MKKLVAGIKEFRRTVQPAYREKFAHLALGQSPDCLFFGCSDSRVIPSVFASTQPGDLFVVRNVGNLVPPCDPDGAQRSEAAAVEFALEVLNVRDIVVCGHSECGAMRALVYGEAPEGAPSLHGWLEVAQSSLARLDGASFGDPGLSQHNLLSQVNVLQQLDNLRTFPVVRDRLEKGTVTLHAWWFDLAHAEVSAFDEATRRFIPIGAEEEARA